MSALRQHTSSPEPADRGEPEPFELVDLAPTGVLPGFEPSAKQQRENNAAVRKFIEKFRKNEAKNKKEKERQEKKDADKLAKEQAAAQRAEERAQKKQAKQDAIDAEAERKRAAAEERAAADATKTQTVEADVVVNALFEEFLVVLDDLTSNTDLMTRAEQKAAIGEELKKMAATVQERQASVEEAEREVNAIKEEAEAMKKQHLSGQSALTNDQKAHLNARYKEAKEKLAKAAAAKAEADANYAQGSLYILSVRKDIAVQSLYAQNSNLEPLVTAYDLYKAETDEQYAAMGLPERDAPPQPAGKKAAFAWQRALWRKEPRDVRKRFEALAVQENDATFPDSRRESVMKSSEHAWSAVLGHYNLPNKPPVADVTQRKTLSVVVAYDRPGGVSVSISSDWKRNEAFAELLNDVFEGASKAIAAKGLVLKRWNHDARGAELVLKGIALEIACYNTDAKYSDFRIDFPSDAAGPSDAAAGPSTLGPRYEDEDDDDEDDDPDAGVTSKDMFGSDSDDEE